MSNEVLGVIVGIMFFGLGLVILLMLNKLSSKKYYRLLLIIVASIVLCFGIYLGWRSIYLYG